MGVDTRQDALVDGNRAGDPRQTSDPPRATVAILDDDEMFRESLARVLRLEGYAVLEAGDTSSLEGLLAAHPVDLVVADSRLPDGDGWATAEALAERYPDLIVLPVSGYDRESIAMVGGVVVDSFRTKDAGRFGVLKAIEDALKAR